MIVKVDIADRPAGERDRLMTQTEEVLRRRLAGLGIASPAIARDGSDRIVVDIPDYSDMERLRGLFSSAHILSFRAVDDDLKDGDIRAGHVPPGVDVVPFRSGDEAPLAVYRSEVVSGARILDAHEEHDSATGQPMVTIRFDDLGKEQLAAFTKENIGKRFAIVLDGRVLTAPMIVDPIPGGRAQIAGNFSEQQASDLAISLRAGAAPEPWSILELKQTP